jgi:hypothetical protein
MSTGAERAAGELRLDRRAVDGDPAIEAFVLGCPGSANEVTPEPGPVRRALGPAPQLLELVARASPQLLGEQALERVLEMPFAWVELGLGPVPFDRLQHAAVGVADDPQGFSGQRAAWSRALTRKGRWSSSSEASAGHPLGRGARRPPAHRLHPVGDQLPVGRFAELAGPWVKAEAVCAIAGDARRAHIAGAGTDRLQRLGDPTGDELVVARAFGPSRRSTWRSHCSHESCHDPSPGNSSVSTCGLPPRGAHL